MEGVAGMMRGLKLSEEENKGVKIKVASKEKEKDWAIQAVGKVMSERLAHPDAICLTLGKVWCPIKGIDFKEIGVNQFLFTFHQESGKRKAVENGPWMFDKDLVVVEDYAPRKRPEDYAFNDIPIWVRVFNLSLGMMNEDSVEDIGNIIGRFVEADTGSDGSAIGRFLRLKVRMRIDKPIMRGLTLEEGEQKGKRNKDVTTVGNGDEEEEGDWCRFEYEYLPDFCFTCGVIGHGDKDCTTKLKKGERQQYGRWLRADLGQWRGAMEEGSWRSGTRSLGSSRNYGYSRSGEDASAARSGNPKRLELQEGARPKGGETKENEDKSSAPQAIMNKDIVMSVEDKGTVDQEDSGGKQEGEHILAGEKIKSPIGKRYKKKGMDKVDGSGNKEREAVLGLKRGRVEEDVEKAGKKGRAEETSVEATNDAKPAGLLEQPRRAQ
nr:uncharacterized protein LOC109748244 [Aegilops tauschii subsp. strangulata]